MIHPPLDENSLTIRPVSIENWSAFEALFEAKGGPSYCWCMGWRMTPEELKHNTAPFRKEFIRQRVWAGIPIGLLAYMEGHPIGWCSVAPRETYRALGGDESLEHVWSVTCFYIQKAFRHRGLVRILIEHAKTYARDNGAKYLEAYPVKPDSPSYHFMGYVKTFEKAGFSSVKRTGARRYVMVFRL